MFVYELLLAALRHQHHNELNNSGLQKSTIHFKHTFAELRRVYLVKD